MRQKTPGPRLLDTFCKAGGCAVGYHRAGFEVVGVDIEPQKRFPFEFHQAGALDFIREHGHEFDVIHASPPCQRYSEATPMQYRTKHPDLIRPTREALRATHKPYVIENVENARRELINPIKLCGTMFGLSIWRHRYFEIWPFWFLTPTCKHNRRPITVHSGSNTRKTWEPVRCTGGARQGVRPRESVEVVRWAMEIPWMVQSELTQAIPPAYTEWLGRQLREMLGI